MDSPNDASVVAHFAFKDSQKEAWNNSFPDDEFELNKEVLSN